MDNKEVEEKLSLIEKNHESKFSRYEKYIDEKVARIEKQFEKIDERTQSMDGKIGKGESAFWVIITVALFFGVGGGYGAIVLTRAKDELASLSKELAGMHEAISKQKQVSIDSIVRQENISLGRIDKSALDFLNRTLSNSNLVLDGKVQTFDCEPGTRVVPTIDCKCPDGYLMVGIRNKDFLGDGKQYENTNGILCAKVKWKPKPKSKSK